MGIKEEILADRLTAMKAKDTLGKTVLSTLLGELDRINKNPSDDEIIKVIKKMMENNLLTNCSNENEYLKKYLPHIMNEEEIKEVIKSYIEKNDLKDQKSIGLIMKYLKDNYNNQYDGTIASKVVKEILNK